MRTHDLDDINTDKDEGNEDVDYEKNGEDEGDGEGGDDDDEDDDGAEKSSMIRVTMMMMVLRNVVDLRWKVLPGTRADSRPPP